MDPSYYLSGMWSEAMITSIYINLVLQAQLFYTLFILYSGIYVKTQLESNRGPLSISSLLAECFYKKCLFKQG